MSNTLKRFLFVSGNGESGKIGLGSVTATNYFTSCMGLADVELRSVSCGNAFTAAVSRCGSLFTFGSNEGLQLGHSEDLLEVPIPREVRLPDAVVSVSAGGAHTLAVTEEGTVWGWGDNRYGQVGTGSLEKHVRQPTKIRGLPRIIKVAAGASHTIALSDEGEVFAWGSNQMGQAGVGLTGFLSWFKRAEHRTPRLLRDLAAQAPATDIAAGYHHSLAATHDSGCFGWGTSKWWQLGFDEAVNAAAPTQVPGSHGFSQLAASGTFSGAVTGNGALHMWGTDINNRGVLGEGPFQQRKPHLVEGVHLHKLALGFQAAAGISSTAQLLTWGFSGDGASSTWVESAHGIGDAGSQLGHGDETSRKRPSAVQSVQLAAFGGAPERLLPQRTDDGTAWFAEDVACGIDHMAAVIAVDIDKAGLQDAVSLRP